MLFQFITNPEINYHCSHTQNKNSQNCGVIFGVVITCCQPVKHHRRVMPMDNGLQMQEDCKGPAT
jgi:hypothetical protein